VAVSDPATAHFTAHKKPRKHKKCIQTKAHAHPHNDGWRKQNQFPKRCVVISISYWFVCHCVFLCILYWYFGPPCVLWFVSSCVTNCHLGFSGFYCFKGVRGCACALVCMHFLCFLGFLCAVKCAVAGSLIATCVWLTLIDPCVICLWTCVLWSFVYNF
jgi:hypothetical protein